MNLVIDQGNTLTKWAVYDNNQMVKYLTTPTVDKDVLSQLLHNYPIQNGIYCSVTADNESTKEELLKKLPKMLLFTHTTPIPLTIKYQTPHTLGLDRIAASVGARIQTKITHLLIIDAGSAITYEYLADNNYLGGNIAPGLTMRLQALHQQTGKLPLVSKEGEHPLIGFDTETAIRSGVITGVIHEIEGYITALSKKHTDFFVFLTGGDAKLLSIKLKNTIFVEQFLVLNGLNEILNYNVKK